MPGARFFPDARLNFAENLLRYHDDQPALVFRNERGLRRQLSYRRAARRGRAHRRWPARRRASVAGDRVAGFLPNLPGSRHRHAGHRQPAERSGPRARRTSACTACSIASGRSRRRCCSRADGYFYAGKRSIPCRRWRRCWRKLAAVERVVVSPVRSRARRCSRRSAPRPHAPRSGRLRHARRTGCRFARCPSTIRSTSCIPPARRASRSASCTAPAARCCSTRRSICCTPTSSAATGCSTSRPAAG